MKNSVFIHSVFITAASFACSAASFTNLGFDDGDMSDLPGPDNRPHSWYAPASKVLPGWSIYFGSTNFGGVAVNNVPLSSENAATLGDIQEFGNAVDLTTTGRTFLALQLMRDTKESPAWTLEQTGTVPAETAVLTYRSYYDPLEMRINGKTIPPLNSRPSLDRNFSPNLMYDISEFAGQEVKLQFAGPFGKYGSVGGPEFGGVAYIDSVAFYPRRGPLVVTQISGESGLLMFTFPVSAGHNYVVESRDNLAGADLWVPLPGGPHNSGSVTDTISGTQRFYRLRISNPQ